MTRKILDSSQIPSDIDCSVVITGTEDEVLDAATARAVDKHGHTDPPELRRRLPTRTP